MIPGIPGGFEFLLLMGIALLLFGRQLPEVAKNVGKGLREFQNGLKGLQSDVQKSTSSSSSSYASGSTTSASRPIPEEEQDEDDFDVPKFEPPTSAPVAESATASDEENPHHS